MNRGLPTAAALAESPLPTLAPHGARVEKRTFEEPDEIISFVRGNGFAARVVLGDEVLVRETLLPGWRWTRDMQTIAGTDACEVEHVRYVLAGAFRIEMTDGSIVDLGPGDLAHIPPGHTGLVIGNIPCVMLDITPPCNTSSHNHRSEP